MCDKLPQTVPVSAEEEILPELTAPDDNTEAQTTTPAEDNTGTEETL